MNQRDRVAGFGQVAGFNTLSKMYYLYDVIKASSSKCCVEIGVFGGRTLIPMALACLDEGGQVTGIDPWNAGDAVQPELPFQTDCYDYDKLYSDLQVLLKKEGLSNVRLIKGTSASAAASFEDNSIDFIHIDGNHSTDKVLQDATLYLPKVKVGGIIVMDDVGFKTVASALDYLRERCEHLNTNQVAGRDDMTFKKRGVPA